MARLGELAPLDSLEPIETVQLYQHISLRLEDQIRSGRWRPGQRLPSERQLARSLMVSRPSLREALAALQVRGVLETRQGSATRVGSDALEVLGPMGEVGPRLPLQEVGPVALLEIREVLEPAAAALAAPRFVQDPELEGFLTVMASEHARRDLHAWNEADRLFHRRIAVLTGNPVFVEFADYISTVMDQPLWRELRDEMLAAPGRIESSMDEHQRIVDSLRRGQSNSGAAHALEHVRAVRKSMGLDPS